MQTDSPNVELARVARLVKAAYNRWPAGSSKGGQFAPKGGQGITAPQLGLFGGAVHGLHANTFHEAGWDGSGMWEKPKAPPKGAKPHPEKDDKGRDVTINYPSKPSDKSTWKDPHAVATFVPGGEVPKSLNGVAMKPWTPPEGQAWAKVEGQKAGIEDGPIVSKPGKSVGTGVVIMEPDGRVWLTKPTNEFGGYKATYPKGTHEPGLPLQANAIKEAFEETGLKVEIVGVIGDYERSTSVARMYLARRTGGTPAAMGWESQAVRLAPANVASRLLNKPHDKEILEHMLHEVNIGKSKLAPLYVSRRVLNAEAIIAWFKAQGLKAAVPPEEMHVTIAYSKQPLDWSAVRPDTDRITAAASPEGMHRFDGSDALVMHVDSEELQQRWQQFIDAGASWDYEGYHPHVTITWDTSAKPDQFAPWPGVIELGAEHFEKLDENWKDSLVEKADGAWQKQPRWPAGSSIGGQWKTYDSDGVLMPPKVGSSTNPGPEMKAQALYAAAKKGDMDKVQAFVVSNAAALQKFQDAKLAGKVNSHTKWSAGVVEYGAQLLSDHNAKAKAVATAEKLAGPEKLSDMKYVAAKPGGSNPGAQYADKSGAVWLVKGSNGAKDDNRAKNEVLASKLMAAAGIGVPNMKLVELGDKYGGGLGVGSQMMQGLANMNAGNPAHVAAAQADFAVHAWLANYDALGMSMDNTMIGPGGKAVMIDPGGALLYRAQGLPKNPPPGNKATEWDSMRDPKINANGAKVYGSMTASQLAESAAKLATISDDTIKSLVKAHGPGDDAAKEKLAATLIARKVDILARAAAGILAPKIAELQAAAGQKVGGPATHAQVLAAAQALAAEKKPATAAAAPAAAPSLPAKPTHMTPIKQALADKIAAGLAAGDAKAVKEAAGKVIAQYAGSGKSQMARELKAYAHAALDHVNGKTAAPAKPAASAMPEKPALPGPVQHFAVDHLLSMAGKGDLGAAKQQADHIHTLALGDKSGKWDAASKYATAVIAHMEGKSESARNQQAAASAAKPATPPPSNAATALLAVAPPVFDSGLPSDKFYSKTADTLAAYHAKGDLGSVKAVMAMPGKVFEGKTTNSKKLVAYANALVKDLEGKQLAQAASTVAAAQEKLKPVQEVPKAGEAKGSNPAMPHFEKAKLPAGNTNASSHNTKVDAIAMAAMQGDVKGLLAMGFGTNTYGKKQAQLANDALAALGVSDKVLPGQKAGTHAALTGGVAMPTAVKAVAQAHGDPGKIAAPTPKPVVQIKSEMLPPKLDFINHNGPGKGLSSKASVNQQNAAMQDAIEQMALKGDLAALKGMTYQQLDAQGHPTGKTMPVGEHPSKHVQAYYFGAIDAVDTAINPPRPLKMFDGQSFTSVSDVSKAFKPKPLGTKAHAVKSNEKLGFWVALGAVNSPEKFKPAHVKDYSAAQISAGYEQYKKLSPLSKQFVSNIQASGSFNDAFRQGKTEYHGQNLKALAAATEKDAAVLDEGTSIYRWQNMPKEMVDTLLKAQPGLIIQATGPMCTSYHPTATQHFGQHRVKIVAAKGAKAINSFGSGGYGGEKEVSTLAGSRFMLQSVKKVPPSGRLEIELLMLPHENIAAD